MTIDPMLLDLFRAEMETHLPVLNEGLLALEKQPADAKQLEAMMRAAHSIKGAAKIVGVTQTVQVAHVLEDCFVAAQNQLVQLTPDAVDVLLAGVDALQRINAGEELNQSELTELLSNIEAIRKGVRPPSPAPTPATAPVSAAEATPAVSAPPTAPATPPTASAVAARSLHAVGILDAANADRLRQELAQSLRQQNATVQLDLSAVEDIEPEGLTFLALAARLPRVQLVNPTNAVRNLLELTRISTPA
jgi:two-component system sensor histidine kinase and response regulator WspE